MDPSYLIQPMNQPFFYLDSISHPIGGNREHKFFNKVLFSIAENNIFDCQNRYYGNRKRLICVRQLPFWQSKTLYLAIVNDL